jgi:hypothetical protein
LARDGWAATGGSIRDSSAACNWWTTAAIRPRGRGRGRRGREMLERLEMTGTLASAPSHMLPMWLACRRLWMDLYGSGPAWRCWTEFQVRSDVCNELERSMGAL